MKASLLFLLGAIFFGTQGVGAMEGANNDLMSGDNLLLFRFATIVKKMGVAPFRSDYWEVNRKETGSNGRERWSTLSRIGDLLAGAGVSNPAEVNGTAIESLDEVALQALKAEMAAYRNLDVFEQAKHSLVTHKDCYWSLRFAQLRPEFGLMGPGQKKAKGRSGGQTGQEAGDPVYFSYFSLNDVDSHDQWNQLGNFLDEKYGDDAVLEVAYGMTRDEIKWSKRKKNCKTCLKFTSAASIAAYMVIKGFQNYLY